jgi:hypothetical protein
MAHLRYELVVEGDIPTFGRFDGTTVTQYAVEVQSEELWTVRPADGPMAVVGGSDGATEMLFVGFKEFSLTDELWDETLHHYRIDVAGNVAEPAAPISLNSAWLAAGGTAKANFVDMKCFWHDGELQLFLVLQEVGTETDGVQAGGLGLLHAVLGTSGWSQPTLIAWDNHALALHHADTDQNDSALYLIKGSKSSLDPDGEEEWFYAELTGSGFAGWHPSPNLEFYSQQANLKPGGSAWVGDGKIQQMLIAEQTLFIDEVPR